MTILCSIALLVYVALTALAVFYLLALKFPVEGPWWMRFVSSLLLLAAALLWPLMAAGMYRTIKSRQN